MPGSKLYVQYGCGPFSAPPRWANYDASPTLRIQQLPVIGKLLRKRMHVAFHPDIILGDIIKGLPGVAADSCDGIYCSHVLEHLSYTDCVTAVRNTFRLLKPGGYFRCVVPDLEVAAKRYIDNLDGNDRQANIKFMEETLLGKQHRTRGFKQMIQGAFGNNAHLYMWDALSLSHILEENGFKQVRRCRFNDCPDEMFRLVEEENRFNNAVALEATK
ncbi:class I SAM-dependent methyltransferase [Chitinophaga nivalis]|uniref:Methyltransferase domain-containing protein n=1 Tax=Chitinophaga nivalis TaxID=2991709 RepID=A0ABT3IEV5_9BACT|nr:methyltransferase domain-containing protein [Chitinophaga nivalis]MCW3467873.1 methyltransferase domain-containing protein [Chitinophaga nivalis]MCW3482436.1 methyltransferase domain-containing protein [Chitinophaga nivalis]